MDTKITITEQAPAENSTELSEETLSQITGGAYDAFLKIDGIDGESTDKSNRDWIQILSY